VAGNPVNFDGTNDFLELAAGLTGGDDNRRFLFAGWIRDLAGTGVRRILSFIASGSTRVWFRLETTGVFTIQGRNNAGTQVLGNVQGPTISDTDWHHFAISVDLQNTLNRSFYWDGTEFAATWNTYTNDVMDFTPAVAPVVAIGRFTSGTPEFWNGDMADLYFDIPAAYFDLDTPANLAKLVDASGPYWVDLGSDGSNVSGSAPLLFLSGTTSTWHTNDGTGGGFTLTGALTNGSVPVPTNIRKIILTRPA
jgi:hypothetical protein